MTLVTLIRRCGMCTLIRILIRIILDWICADRDWQFQLWTAMATRYRSNYLLLTNENLDFKEGNFEDYKWLSTMNHRSPELSI